jgi:molybdate transport system substrate-binding protein
MKKFSLSSLVFALTLTVLTSISFPSNPSEAATKKTELLVSAAASMQDSLETLEKLYEKAHPTVNLVFNYGSSGTLQKQIEQGAPADLFISAGKKQMDALVKEDLISDNKTLLKNDLVMVVPTDSKIAFKSVKDLAGKSVKKVAIGQPESVPAGQYAKETLTKLKAWDTVKDKVVYAKDVRQVLSYVETGNVEAGFVYKTDAITSKKVKVAIRVAPEAHSPIIYTAGVVKESNKAAEAKKFYAYLQTKEAGAVFVRFGFRLP